MVSIIHIHTVVRVYHLGLHSSRRCWCPSHTRIVWTELGNICWALVRSEKSGAAARRGHAAAREGGTLLMSYAVVSGREETACHGRGAVASSGQHHNHYYSQHTPATNGHPSTGLLLLLKSGFIWTSFSSIGWLVIWYQANFILTLVWAEQEQSFSEEKFRVSITSLSDELFLSNCDVSSRHTQADSLIID